MHPLIAPEIASKADRHGEPTFDRARCHDVSRQRLQKRLLAESETQRLHLADDAALLVPYRSELFEQSFSIPTPFATTVRRS